MATIKALRAAAQTASGWTGIEWDSSLDALASQLAKAGTDPRALAKVAERWEGSRIHSYTPDNGSCASQQTEQDLTRLARMVRDCDPDALGLAERLATEERESVEEQAEAAAEHGAAAVVAAEAGEWDDALSEINRACSLEREYGDDPSWGPVRRMIENMAKETE
jgi:hypothetical protein